MKVGDTFEVKQGTVEILDYIDSKQIEVMFLCSGYCTWVRSEHLHNKSIKHPYYPTVQGKGFLGEGIYTRKEHLHLYKIWSAMLSRCYGGYEAYYQYYNECSVCEEWLDFQKFCSWAEPRYIKGYSLDKDSIVPHNKLYDPSTCKFIPIAENSRETHTRTTGTK